jgi:RNA polymerase sigma-70 factor (ECF subfamily)
MSDSDQFITLYAKHEPNIRRYVYSLVGDVDDMEDIMQNTAMALWKKFDDYDRSQPFVAWALRFSYYEVMKHRERAQRRQRLCLETLALISDEFKDRQHALRDQRRVLRQCIGKLPDEQANLIQQRYVDGKKIRQIAGEMGRPEKPVYRLFDKIRKALFVCVSTQLAQEAG